MRSGLITTAVLAALFPSLAPAQPAPAPAAAPAAVNGAMKVHIEEVTGIVRVRADEKAPWKKAVAGMDVDEGAEFQTGPKSSVRCSIPPDQSFTLDRLGTVKVLQAIRDGNKVKTDMLMKYGRTKYQIEQAGLDHESTIATPSNTLAVRGTKVMTYDQPPFAYAVETDHFVQLRDARRTIGLGSNKSSSKVRVEQGKSSAADTALSNSVIDPRYALSRTQAENVYIAQQISRGGIVSFDPLANILVVRNSNPILDDAQLARALPAPLDFTLRWNKNSDVNLGVFIEFGNPTAILFGTETFTPSEYLYPGYGLNVSKSGGRIPFDDRGGPKGGTELAFFKNPPAGAVYGISATLISGGATDIKLNAFLNGQRQFVYSFDADGNFVKSLTINLSIKPGDTPQTALVFIPTVPLLEQMTPDQGRTDGTTPTTPGKDTKRAAIRARQAAAAMTSPRTPTATIPTPAAAVTPRHK